jgi:hypothetical protein
MSDEPKFISLSPSRGALLSGNGNGHKPHVGPPSESAHFEEPQPSLKHALFYLAVASLLILSGVLARISEPPNPDSSRPSLRGIALVLHPRVRPDNQVDLTVRFRLSNMGNRPVLYPVRPDTNVPIGQILTRVSPSSEWMTLSSTSQQQSPAGPESMDRNLAWIEMLPGGWVDGEFSDRGESGRDHAYAIFLKPDRDGGEVRIVSQPYHFNSN